MGKRLYVSPVSRGYRGWIYSLVSLLPNAIWKR
jgi:hypothetical protein